MKIKLAIRLMPGLAIFLYLRYLNAGYFSDDFLFYYNSPPAHLYDYFLKTGAVAHAYRPLEAIFLTLVQRHFVFQTWPIHVVAVIAHMALCGLTIAAGARLGFRPAEKILAAALVLVTQAGPSALLGNDTLSQAMSSMLGFLSIFLFDAACFDSRREHRQRISRGLFCSSVLCFLASLFFKETALGFSLILCAIAIAAAGMKRTWPARLGTAARTLIPFAVAGAIYIVARVHAGGQIAADAGDTYKISAGFNVLRNLALFAAGAFNPASSVTVAIAAQTREIPILGLAVAATLVVSAVILAGIFTVKRKIVVVWLLGCSLAALFPVFLLQHVSELYFYNAVPFVALLFSIALGSLWDKGPRARAGVAACTLLLIGGQIQACLQKSSLMYGNGRRAAAVIADLVPRIRSLPENGRIILVQPPRERLKYSVYVLDGFDILEFGVGRIGAIFGRPDVQVSIAEEAQARRPLLDADAMKLTLVGDALRPLGI